MKIKSALIFIKLSNLHLNFTVFENAENNNKLIYSENVLSEGIENNTITDFNCLLNLIKTNILTIEQKFDLVFKEVVIILDIFHNYLINFSGFKNLNSSQLTKENVTYIINLLRAKISETEKKKRVIHIFNSKYILDGQALENLPIGLFGNFYSHELSFFLIKENDFKNIQNIFKKCNLRIKKVISNDFLEGINLINNNKDLDNFFKIKIKKDISQITFFENSSIKFVQHFNFGTNFILSDISKITGLNIEIIKSILEKSNFSEESSNDLVEKDYFKDVNFRKIKKQLIIEIAEARIKEFSNLILLKNINVKKFLQKGATIFLQIDDNYTSCFKQSYETLFSNNFFKTETIWRRHSEDYLNDANTLVQFGWKSEAIPITRENKSFIARIFEKIFK